MKRSVYDILKERGRIVEKSDGFSYLFYCSENGDGTREAHNKKFHHEALFDIQIEDTWVDFPVKRRGLCVGMSWSFPYGQPRVEDLIMDRKRVIFDAILIKIFVDNLQPLSAVHIWHEQRANGEFRIIGICEVKKNGSTRDIS